MSGSDQNIRHSLLGYFLLFALDFLAYFLFFYIGLHILYTQDPSKYLPPSNAIVIAVYIVAPLLISVTYFVLCFVTRRSIDLITYDKKKPAMTVLFHFWIKGRYMNGFPMLSQKERG